MKKYSIILCDPPWSYYNDMDAEPDVTTVKGMRRPPYKVLSSKTIAELPVNKIANQDCLLFIWTTDYHLDKCMGVIKAWGFEYKTIAFAWLKQNKAGKPVTFMGAYTMKSGIELCLLATKGKNAHRLVQSHKVRSLIESPRLEHSAKPPETRTRIVELLGDLPRIELFARETVTGWDALGDGIDGKDIGTILRNL